MNSSYWSEGLMYPSKSIAAIDCVFVIPQDSCAEPHPQHDSVWRWTLRGDLLISSPDEWH